MVGKKTTPITARPATRLSQKEGLLVPAMYVVRKNPVTHKRTFRNLGLAGWCDDPGS